MSPEDPSLEASSKSQRMVVDGYPFSIEICRIEGDENWSLEVVDHEGTSHVWNELFKSDDDARNAAVEAFEKEGAMGFMKGDNVVPLRPK